MGVLTTVEEIDPGIIVVRAQGGTHEDRASATLAERARLAQLGYEHAQFDPIPDKSQRTASWNDVQEKAQRLLAAGNVHIIRNSVNNVVGQVQGDNDTYQTEFSRDDPNSSSITQWSCECPWSQFSWGRTRQFKRYEGRVCWSRGSKVNMANGTHKNIEDVRPGDRVLTTGGSQLVSGSWENRYQGRMLTFKRVGGADTSTVTEDHKMIINRRAGEISRDKDSKNSTKCARLKVAISKEALWEKTLAKDVRVGDWVKIAYPTEEHGFSLNVSSLSDYFHELDGRVYKSVYTKRSAEVDRHERLSVSSTLPATLTNSKALLTIAGYYLAEGSIEGKGRIVSWCFHEDELGYVERLDQALQDLGAFPLRRYPAKPGGPRRMIVKSQNSVLVEVLRYLCGSGSRDKVLAPELMMMPRDDQRFFLDRYSEGDGCIADNGVTVLTTASDSLARQITSMAPRAYTALSAGTRGMNSGGPTNRDKKTTVNHIRVNQKYNTGMYRIEDGYYAAKITEIKESRHDGFVYNLTVPPHHTVAVDDILNFQCSHALSLYWQALRTPLDDDNHPALAAEPPPQQGPPGQPVPYPGPGAAMQDPQDGSQAVPPDLLPQLPQADPLPRGDSTPGAYMPSPANPIQYPGGTFSSVQGSWKLSADFQNGQIVQIKDVGDGVWFGRSDAHGSGQPAQIPAGTVGEVMGEDPNTHLVDVIFPSVADKNGKMEPYGARGWFMKFELEPRPDIKQPGPAVRRRVPSDGWNL